MKRTAKLTAELLIYKLNLVWSSTRWLGRVDLELQSLTKSTEPHKTCLVFEFLNAVDVPQMRKTGLGEHRQDTSNINFTVLRDFSSNILNR